MAHAFEGTARETAFLELVDEISGVAALLWSEEGCWASRENHPGRTDPAFCRRLYEDCKSSAPGIFFESNLVIWGFLNVPGAVIALGPARINLSEDACIRSYPQTHRMSTPYDFPIRSFQEMAKVRSLVSLHVLGTSVLQEKLVFLGHGAEHVRWESEGDLSQYHLDQSELDRSHQSGREFEALLISAVRNGDVEQMKQLMSGATPGLSENGEVAREEQKQIEYMIVSQLTLLTRAAVEGGMRAEAAYNLGDVYLRRLAQASVHGGAFTTLAVRAMYEFAEGVRQAKLQKSEKSHVEACKAYIEANLQKNLQVGQIAPALGLNRSYLSRLFKKEEGITIQLYVQREKCRFAERQLKYTDYPISLISEYFGFSSPGYFGTCFQRWYGLTPNEYRNLHAKK